MLIISSYEQSYNPITSIFTVITDEILCCPLCGGILLYLDSKPRGLKNLAGLVSRFLLRRLRCSACGKIHTELPDIIQPYKHYDSETIQHVLDGSAGASYCAADDSTMRRWKSSFAESAADISQRLTSIRARISDEKIPIQKSEEILNLIRGEEKHWLAFVMALLINSGHKLHTRFAFCPAEFSVKVNVKIKTEAEGGQKIDKTFDDSS